MNKLPKPSGLGALTVLLKRSVMATRHRETQPGLNQPRQNTLPNS
jgi:hypothetical protein